MTKPIHLAAAALLSLAACGEGGETAQTRSAVAGPVSTTAPAGGWVSSVAETPEGGFRMGNPDAAIKIVEFASLTCSHCASFSNTGAEPLKQRYISTGNVSYEIRPFVSSGLDLAAVLLARCNGPQPFFPITEQLYQTQGEWIGRVQQMPRDQQAQLQGMAPEQQVATFARAAGLDQFVRQRGVPEAKAQACLSDRAAIDKLVEGNNRAIQQYNIPGTPTFLINGEVAEGATTWNTLEPLLQAELS